MTCLALSSMGFFSPMKTPPTFPFVNVISSGLIIWLSMGDSMSMWIILDLVSGSCLWMYMSALMGILDLAGPVILIRS